MADKPMLEELYTILRTEQQEGTLVAEVQLQARHAVFEGHFPGNPVLPGVCQLYLIRKLLANDTAMLSIRAIRELKFLAPIIPTECGRLEVRLTTNRIAEGLSVQGTIQADGATKTKIKAIFAD